MFIKESAMSFIYSIGGLIPLWILGGPLLAGLVALASLPKPVRRQPGRDAGDRTWVVPPQ